MKKAFTLFLTTFICTLICTCYISVAQSMDSMCAALENSVSASLAKKGIKQHNVSAGLLHKHITDRGATQDVITLVNDSVDPTMNLPAYLLASLSGLSDTNVCVDSILRLNTRNTDEIKSAAQSYGSVIISYCYNGTHENDGVYVSGTDKSHANRYGVITGWSDNHWVVADNVFDGGFAFIPFDESSIGDIALAVDCSKAEYTHVYQYDGGYSFDDDKAFGHTAYMSNLFVAQRDERLKSIGFFVNSNENVDYEIQIYRDPVDSKSPVSGYQAYILNDNNRPEKITINGRTSKPGYYTVEFPQDIILKQEDEFAVVIRLKSDEMMYTAMDTDEVIRGTDGSVLLESESNSLTEQSYISADFVSWQEISLVGNRNVRIKAFTEEIVSPSGNVRFIISAVISGIIFGGYFWWKYKKFRNEKMNK